MAGGGKWPRLFHAVHKYSIASWSFWVQKHVCGIKIDTSDALSGHLKCQISKTFFFWKKNEASYERPLIILSTKTCLWYKNWHSDALSGHLRCQISKTFFWKKNEASYERPPVLNGHFWLALVVAVQKRFYCILMFWIKTCLICRGNEVVWSHNFVQWKETSTMLY